VLLIKKLVGLIVFAETVPENAVEIDISAEPSNRAEPTMSPVNEIVTAVRSLVAVSALPTKVPVKVVALTLEGNPKVRVDPPATTVTSLAVPAKNTSEPKVALT
jgi:hypothetical protein